MAKPLKREFESEKLRNQGRPAGAAATGMLSDEEVRQLRVVFEEIDRPLRQKTVEADDWGWQSAED